jgi:trk system potassium uptake protein TrkH
VWRNRELRLFGVMLLICGALIVFGLARHEQVTTAGETVDASAAHAARYGLFNYVSMQTDTGFATADFDRWPFLPMAVLLAMTFVGGCSGSTTGGVKFVRVLIVGKIVIRHVERAFRPNLVRPIRVGRDALEPEERIDALVYVVSFALILLFGACALHLIEGGDRIDFTSAFTASLATLCTAGPGLGRVGPTANYEWFSDASKIVMSLLMILGRLEIFAILVLFTPRFWGRE